MANRGRLTLTLVSLASLGWAFSFGLGAPLSALWLGKAGCSHSCAGINASLYYLGVALASPFVPLLMRRANRACVIGGMLLDAVTTAIFPFCHDVALWHFLRFAAGVGTALSLIPMETLVNRNASPDRRARDFAVYAVCVALGLALGAVVGVALSATAPRFAFVLGGAVTLVATAFVWFVVPPGAESPEQSEGHFAFRTGILGFATAWVQGFLEGASMTFLAPYLLSLGHTEGTVSGLNGGLFAGVVMAQLPVAWLADRLGRLRVLLACHALVLLGMLLVPMTSPFVLLIVWLFVLGACCGAMYPLGLALLGERVSPASMASANAWYLTCNCAGSLSGPVVMGVVIDTFGLLSQFYAGAGAVVFAVVLGTLTTRRAAPAQDIARRAA